VLARGVGFVCACVGECVEEANCILFVSFFSPGKLLSSFALSSLPSLPPSLPPSLSQEAARLEQNLQRQGFNCLGIHGDKGQNDRIAAIEKFKTKEVPLLIATDVAARGLDIPDVEVVINYSFPLTIEDYVHRYECMPSLSPFFPPSSLPFFPPFG